MTSGGWQSWVSIGAFTLSTISLWRTFVVDARDRRRLTLLELNRVEGTLKLAQMRLRHERVRWQRLVRQFSSDEDLLAEVEADIRTLDEVIKGLEKVILETKDIGAALERATWRSLEGSLVRINRNAFEADHLQVASEELKARREHLLQRYSEKHKG
ncbi:MAG: hypothetical protein KGN33_18055 [Paracoccaceae bacterium]|nr:hypothetical protein [Paracoccaceae bacterium]